MSKKKTNKPDANAQQQAVQNVQKEQKKKLSKKEKKAIAEQRSKELNQKKTRNYGIGFVFSLIAFRMFSQSKEPSSSKST